LRTTTYTYLPNSPMVYQLDLKQSSALRLSTLKQYDKLNRLQTVFNTPASGALPVVFDYAYNRANQRQRRGNGDGTFWRYDYNALGQVIGGKKYWNDWTPVAGQQFEYGFDDIGNRTSTKAGGDASGAGMRAESYTANSLNQDASKTVAGAADDLGVALTNLTVTVNGQATYRKGEYFRKEIAVSNGSVPVWQALTNAATKTRGQVNS
jgi:YD repeat-containing protein